MQKTQTPKDPENIFSHRASSLVGRILAGYGNAPPNERFFTATLIVTWRDLDVSACTFSYHPGNRRRHNSSRILLRLLATRPSFRLLGLGSLCMSNVLFLFFSHHFSPSSLSPLSSPFFSFTSPFLVVFLFHCCVRYCSNDIRGDAM